MTPSRTLTTLAVLFALVLPAAASPYVFVDEAAMEKARGVLRSGDAGPAMRLSYRHLLEEAALAMADGPFSVTDKTMTPPSGDKHDYLSLSPYWWPDESRPDGLPWIRKDGKTNPASKTDDTDSRRIGRFTRSVRALAVAYYFSGDETYAERAMDYLRTWFLHPATRMNPNLDYAQGVPGVAPGRRSGLIDSRSLADRLLDSLAMLATSTHWTEADHAGLRAWYRAYLDWLLTDELPTSEADSENNHGSWHDLQVGGIAFYLGRTDLARRMVEKGRMRVDTQIEADGTQPFELARTRSYHYCYFNLDALTHLALLGPRVGVDLWGYTSPRGASLKTAIEQMAAYQDPEKEWPWKHRKPRRVARMTPIYRKAALAYRDDGLMELSKAADFSGYTVEDNLGETWAERDVFLLWPAP